MKRKLKVGRAGEKREMSWAKEPEARQTGKQLGESRISSMSRNVTETTFVPRKK
jgi:hypothetical protein